MTYPGWRRIRLPAYERAVTGGLGVSPSSFNPPAPLAYARVSGNQGASLERVPLLIDSGADVTAVPRAVADALGASPERGVELAGYDGATRIAPIAELSVELFGYRFSGAYVLLEGDHGVVGRDILNHVVTVLDGPALSWSAGRG